MKKKLFVVGTVVASIVLSAVSVAGCSKKEERVEKLPDTFINQTLDFELTPEVATPAPDASSHRGEEIENLVTLYAQSYENDEYLKDDVKLFRQWQWEALYNSLAKKAEENPAYLNTYRLQAEAYLVKSQYQAALAALDKVLSYHHDDVYALGLSAYVQNIQGNTAQRDARLAALKKVSVKCHDDLVELMTKVTGWIAAEHGTEKLHGTGALPYDAIGILGVSPTASGQLQGSGATRVKAAVKAAYYSNSPKIIPSGGAIDTEYTEAKVMGDYIVRNSTTIAQSLELIGSDEKFFIYGDDVILDEQARDTVGNAIGICNIMVENDLHNVLVIASEDQVMRAECIFNAYIDANDLDITVTTHSAGGNSASGNQSKYSYICAATAYGLFTKDDYAEHSKYVIDTTNALTMPKGIVNVDTTTAADGDTVKYSVVPAAGYEADAVTVKTSSGKDVTVNNGSFVMPDENVIVNAKFKPITNTATISFFNGSTFGTNENGITDIQGALAACENDIKIVNNDIVSVTDSIGDDPLITAKNALGYGKMGGFGVASGGRIGGFKLTFNEDYKISKIQVTAVKFAENEGHLQVNGIDPTSGTLKGEANVFDASYVEYSFNEPTNVLDFRTVADTVDGTMNYGRVIIYSVTLFLADSTQIDKVYSINIGGVENGEVTASYSDALPGTEITLSAKGNPHYFLDSYKVMDGNTEVAVDEEGKFIMPAGDVIVSATFVNRLIAETKIEVKGDKTYNSQIVGSVTLDKEAYVTGDTATVTVKVGAGFELDTLVVKTANGKTVNLNSDNTFTFTGEDVVITATFKVKTGTTTLDFFNSDNFGTKNMGSTSATGVTEGYNADLEEFFGDGFVTLSGVDACAYAKYGGFGIASGSKAGAFTLTFASDKKIAKIVINGAKNKNGEGLITVNGVSMGEQTFTAVNGGVGGQQDVDSNVTFEFDTATNTLSFAGVNAKGGGRTIIYSITIYWAD